MKHKQDLCIRVLKSIFEFAAPNANGSAGATIGTCFSADLPKSTNTVVSTCGDVLTVVSMRL